MHPRARSRPSTPEKDYALSTVRVYNHSARPSAPSSPVNGDGDGEETETENEDTPPTCFPFLPPGPIFNHEIDPLLFLPNLLPLLIYSSCHSI